MTFRILSPSGKANRIDYLSVLLAWVSGTAFLAIIEGDLLAKLSPTQSYIATSFVTAVLAWLLICATIRRLEDLNWSWLLALPWIPVAFWPVGRLFVGASVSTSLMGLAGVVGIYCFLTAIAFLFTKGAIGTSPSILIGKTSISSPAASPTAAPIGQSEQPRTTPNSFNPIVGWLVTIDGRERGTEYRLHAHGTRIGRDPAMDVIISDDVVVLRDHARIGYDPHSCRFTIVPDAGSVELNGQNLSRAGTLSAYDRLRIGKTGFVFVPLCGVYHKWDFALARVGAAHA